MGSGRQEARGDRVSVRRAGYRPGSPGVGICQTRVLRLLQAGRYVGTVARLARITMFDENSIWRAIAGLAARELVIANRAGDELELVITQRGRLAAHG